MAESPRTSSSRLFRGRTISNTESNHSSDEVKSSNSREQSQSSQPSNSRARNLRPCRYYLRGMCTRAECLFSHELPSSVNGRHSPIRNTNARRTKPCNSHHNSQNMPSTSSLASSENRTLNSSGDDKTKNLKECLDKIFHSENSSQNMPSTSSHASSESGTSNVNDDTTKTTDEEFMNGMAIPYESRCESNGDVKEASSLISKNDWVNAPEFVPSQPKLKSYAQAVNPMDSPDYFKLSEQHLCPYVTKEGCCRYPPGECSNLHGDLCDLCGKAVMHPFNEELRKKHHQECIKQHEKDMELSFALARSKEKSCGVCFEVIMEKAIGEQRFGILPNCNHCFCLTCIRKWRQARQFENKIIRACPECRITSDFVCPSMYWVDTKEDKDKLIDDYKKALAKKDCKYFKKGGGKCPFGNKCFYLHALADGRICDVGPPLRQRRRRNLEHSDFDVLQHVILWDFLADRSNPWQSLADDLEDLVSFFSDSDESDWSEYDFFYD